MKFLADGNFPTTSVHYLPNRGFDVTAIGIDNPGISDEQPIKIATQEQRTILTFGSDYGELIFMHNYQPLAGLVYNRVLPNSPESPGKLIKEIILSGKIKFEQILTVVDSHGIRQRRY